MNNCKTIYKILKYANKNNDLNYIDNICPNNIDSLYQGLKYLYVNNKNQLGGTSSTVEKTYIDVVRHGSINIGEPLIIPDNVTLIMPFCCGMYHNLGSSSSFFNQSSEDKIKSIDNAGKILDINGRKHLIMRPGDKYCNIDTQMSLKQDIYERIDIDGDNSTKYDEENMESLLLTEEMIELYKIVEAYNLRNAMSRRAIASPERRAIASPESQVTSSPRQTNFILDDDFDDEYIPYEYFHGYMYRLYHKKLFEKIISTTDNDQLKGYLTKKISNIDDITKFDEEEVQKIISVLTKKDIQIEPFIAQDMYDFIKDRVNVYSLTIKSNLLKLISQNYISKSFKYERFMQYDGEDYSMTDVNNDVKDIHKSIFTSEWTKLFTISKMNDVEKRFIREVVGNEEIVNMTLQHHLDFLSKVMPDKHLYINSISCQGFGNNEVCHSYKCLRMLDVNTSELAGQDPFMQENFVNIVNALQYIDDNKLYDISLIDTELYDQYHKFICALFSGKINNPILLAKYFVVYIYNSYRPLFDYLMTFDDITYLGQKVWKNHKQFVKTILNLCITDIYYMVNDDHKTEIKKLME